jgi:hypothetical protein
VPTLATGRTIGAVGRPAVFLVIASVAGAASIPAPARACSFAGPTPYVVDASMQATDHVAPTLAPLTVTRLQRGQKTTGCTSVNSCDGFGSLAISVAAADDVTPATGLGYRFTVVAGTLPPVFSIPLNQPSQVLVSDGQIWFNWDDGTEDHQSIDFTLQVVAIDRAGNESAPQTVRVTDDPGGCAIARPRAPYRGLAFAALAALLLAARHPRRGRAR